jgi:hypothetical protein
MLDSVVDFYVEVCSILPTVFHFSIYEALHLVSICGSGESNFLLVHYIRQGQIFHVNSSQKFVTQRGLMYDV